MTLGLRLSLRPCSGTLSLPRLSVSQTVKTNLIFRDHYNFCLGTTQLDNAAGGQITINRSVDDIFSESVTIRTNSGSGKIVDFDIQASDGVIFAIDSVI